VIFEGRAWPLWAMRQWSFPPAVTTNEQFYLMIGVPILFNAALMGILCAYLKAKFDSLERCFGGIKLSKSGSQL
jgi:hypothetical protein